MNLGCEMIYILDQRLKAQNIPADKSWKVVADVVKTMFDISFVNDKLFVPQEMYSMASTRKIFDRLAHSSIMRLNESRCVLANTWHCHLYAMRVLLLYMRSQHEGTF